jgi:hypothetical protein
MSLASFHYQVGYLSPRSKDDQTLELGISLLGGFKVLVATLAEINFWRA